MTRLVAFSTVDSLVCLGGVVGLKQLCDVPSGTHHDLLHPSRVTGQKLPHIIHLDIP